MSWSWWTPHRGTPGTADVPLAILGTVYACAIAAGWGLAFGLPAGVVAGLVGGFSGGLVALGFSSARPSESLPTGYVPAEGLMAATANAAVCASVLPRVQTALGSVGPMSAENRLTVVVLPALVAAVAGWSARHRLASWYRDEGLPQHAK